MKLPNKTIVSQFLSSLTEKGLVLLAIAYVALSVGRSVIKNYQINQRIQSLEEQIAELKQEKSYLANLIEYYKTDTFKELRSREELGYQKPDEHVLSVPVESGDVPLGAKNFVANMTNENDRPIPNYQKWYYYFFGS